MYKHNNYAKQQIIDSIIYHNGPAAVASVRTTNPVGGYIEHWKQNPAIDTPIATTQVIGSDSISTTTITTTTTMKPNNSGLDLMDMEIETENELMATNSATIAATTTSPVAATTNNNSLPSIRSPEAATTTANYYNLMAAAVAAGSSGATNAAAPNYMATSAMLMDPSSLMAAAAALQIQQNYGAAAAAAAAVAYGSIAGADNATTTTAAGGGVTTTEDNFLTAGVAVPSSAPGALIPTSPGSSTMKEVIKTKNCILFPPNPNAPPPTIRERPPGCRTVFVGGLPENITEEIIREIFESCGEIITLRMSKKNFCHIRYRFEYSIDRAIYLSGYRLRVMHLNEPPNFGRLHVDYAQARDDQYEWECKQRQLQREQRHRERLSIERLRPQSPPPIPHYTDHEASAVAENLRKNDTFIKAVQTIAVWLERGDCTKRNSNVFYSMIQSTHAHVRRLHTDKQQLEEDLRKARESYRKQMLVMSTQFTQIEKVFNAASHKKVWDHFTKAQRKNIDQWKKLATELRSIQIEDDEMEMSDDDTPRINHLNNSAKKAKLDTDNLKEENDSLRCQLAAMRNEMSLERTDLKYNADFREKQIKVLQETIRNLQTQLLQTKVREEKDAQNVKILKEKLKESAVKQLLLKTRVKTLLAHRTAEQNDDAGAENEKQQLLELTPESEGKLARARQQRENNVDNNEKAEEEGDEHDDDDDDVHIVETTTYEIADCIHEILDDDANEVTKDKDKIKQTEVNNDIIIENNNVSLNIITKDNNHDDDGKEADQVEQKQQQGPVVQDKESEHRESPQSLERLDVLELMSSPLINSPIDTNASITNLDSQIIALTAAYLVVHPLGASLEAIIEYLSANQVNINSTTNDTTKGYLLLVLQKYRHLFSFTHETNKWLFCGFPARTSFSSSSLQQQNTNGNRNHSDFQKSND